MQGHSSGVYRAGGPITIRNSILWGNTLEINVGAGVIATYSTVQGGYAGTGNTSSDPLFVDAANGNFSLQTSSLAVNTGDPTINTGGPDAGLL